MRKLVIAGVVVGLVAGSLAAPAGAKKKKKPKPPVPVSVDQKLFLRQDSDSCGSPHTFLSATDGTDLSCFYVDAGLGYEVVNQVETIPTAAWPAEDSVPFVFDTTKKITGEITIHGGDAGTGPVSAGQARFDLVVVAEIAGEVTEIGTVSETWVTTPGDVHVVKLDMVIDPALAGQTVDAFQIDTTLRGAAVGPHTIELDAPPSFVIVPTLKA
ncbi:MAG TPA: hypothetical protein VHJ76_07420 [Actinomycetota bacterium]|nr:hypothetical protein [Actinomycetota bacterium]